MRSLWRGEVPLSRAFWEYAVVYGLIATLCAGGAAAAALIADLPVAIAILLHLLPVPYYLVALVGVWRSAAAYPGPPIWSSLARPAVVVWTIAITVL